MFNEELIKKATIYFSKRWDREVLKEEADEYLNSLADLYLAFSELNSEICKGIDFPAPVGGGESADLISPHNCKD